MYAIIETGGKQVKVSVGDKIYVEKLDVKAGEKYTFDKVLAIVDKDSKFGNPYVSNAKVVAKVEKQGLSKKLHIYKYKAKHNERKRIGHRQPYTCLVVESIN